MVEVDASRILEQRQGWAWRGGRGGGWRRGLESGEEVLAWAGGEEGPRYRPSHLLDAPPLCPPSIFEPKMQGGAPPQCDSEM